MSAYDAAKLIEKLSMDFFVAASHTDGGSGAVFKYPVTRATEIIEGCVRAALAASEERVAMLEKALRESQRYIENHGEVHYAPYNIRELKAVIDSALGKDGPS